MAPPAPPGGWTFRYQSQDAVEGWEDLCKLRGELGWREIDGVRMEQWQYEVTGAGRLWYAVDDARRTAWLTLASVGHPKKTE